MPDMAGKTVLVTGATSGIGLRTALELARMHARILVHGRTAHSAAAAVAAIREEVPAAVLVPLAADLAELAAVRGLAAQVKASTDRLDVLINNAGVYMPEHVETADGFETTLAVNHLAPFALTVLLDDMLVHSAPARIITVSSVAHFRGLIDFEDLNHEHSYDAYGAYADSKLANVLFAFEAASRFSGTGVTSNTLHPGVIETKLLRTGFPGQHGAGTDVGAATSIYVASSSEVDDVTGRYFVNQHPAAASPLAGDHELRNRLWETSELLTGVSSR
jgi:NAD(P)-dependent dehydrogenase (short-subunit alcohol dehydrogenase family)